MRTFFYRAFLALVMLFAIANVAEAFLVNGVSDDFTEGRRWDAAPRSIGGGTIERSLNGGLRWNVQGGSVQTYRDLFSWQSGVPSVPDFSDSLNAAFDAWTVVDPQINLPAQFSFVFDPSTPTVSGDPRQGAEIDLLAGNSGQGAGVTGGITFIKETFSTVTLTSGTSNYPSGILDGADIRLNNVAGTFWTLPLFEKILTHEIGHALGLGDVEFAAGNFIDDNYDGTSQATANLTLTNPFSDRINVLNPSATLGLSFFDVPNTGVGIEASEVHILMESTLDLQQTGMLTADDFAGRQFLYPGPLLIPEPTTMATLLSLGFLLTLRRPSSGAN